MTGIREALAIEGICRMYETFLEFQTSCGLRFPAPAVPLSEMGAFDTASLGRLVEAHRIHHEEDHPNYGRQGHLDVQNHFDPLDGGWVTVTCHH